ncbi:MULTISPECIES: ERF family protein [Methanobacterium]|uniref:Uncharacterized protein n=1 Tax=Methanobacterium bryantii TaxID=2161 RepID=A0A2A2H8D9_METBR|nr:MULTISPECIES: ERF family protein [Methanobacterium]OEC87854.1 hypothetical protein A9507_06680 [Methanobacterium sp. A39]PAV05721.1 hypothetical protein ASJ80_08290 [Methanobacterium bryantii]
MEDGSTSIENVAVTQDIVGINLVKALCKVQEEITNPIAEATNPFFKSKYATLSSILNLVRPLLSKNGLYLYQNAGNDENYVYIETKLIHTSGEYLQSSRLYLKPDKKTPQGIGSTITYGRRYQLAAVLGICDQDDDDGNAAESGESQQKQAPKKPKSTPKTSGTPKSSTLNNGQILNDSVIQKLKSKNKYLDEAISTLSSGDKAITKTNVLKELVEMRDANEFSTESKENLELFTTAKKDLGFKS